MNLSDQGRAILDVMLSTSRPMKLIEIYVEILRKSTFKGILESKIYDELMQLTRDGYVTFTVDENRYPSSYSLKSPRELRQKLAEIDRRNRNAARTKVAYPLLALYCILNMIAYVYMLRQFDDLSNIGKFIMCIIGVAFSVIVFEKVSAAFAE